VVMATTGDQTFTAGSSCAIIASGAGNIVQGLASGAAVIACNPSGISGQGGIVETSSAFIAACTGGMAITNNTSALIANLEGAYAISAASAGGAKAMIANSGGVVDLSSTGAANIVMATTGDQTFTGGESSAILACGAGNSIAGGSSALIAAATACTINPAHVRCAVIGGTGLTSTTSDSLTTGDIYGVAFMMTCDATLKKSLTIDTAGEGTEEMTQRLMSVHPYKYRRLTDDDFAPKRRGLHAQELASAFPDAAVVKTTWRDVAPVTRDSTNDQWLDEQGIMPDPARVCEDAEDPLSGVVGTDRPIPHAYVDTTALAALMISITRHLQIQITSLAEKMGTADAAHKKEVDSLSQQLQQMSALINK